jgi:uncharacterized protein HemX
MSPTTDMNIVLGQGTSIKEVHNVKKDSLEMNQQFVAQQSDDLKREDKSRVQENETNNRIETQKDKERKKGHKRHKRNKDAEEQENELNSEGNVIDIRV